MDAVDRGKMQSRSLPTQFKARKDDSSGDLFIEGYFSVFNSLYELWPGATESVAPGAFADTLSGDIRALTDHETRLVLGRNKAATLDLKEDTRGLWGQIKINKNDTDAMNLYERVNRGDVDQCSFGFDILDEETDFRDDGTVHWTIKKVRLYEVSVVTFPAYQDTSVSARQKDFAEIQKRKTEAWQLTMRAKMKKEANKNGT